MCALLSMNTMCRALVGTERLSATVVRCVADLVKGGLHRMIARRSVRQVLAAVLAAVPLVVFAACPEAQSTADRVQSIATAESTARDALATIRRGAQDWKNLLLRGRDAAERKTMQDRFDAQARSYEERLATLRQQLMTLGLELDRIQKLEDERVKMFGRYRDALTRHGVESLDAAAAADRDAQGVDVTTFRTLEQLIQVVAAQTGAGFKDLRAAIDQCDAPRREKLR